jgi:hypothetical protein
VAAGESGIMIIDISNPALPEKVTTYNTPGFAYDVALKGEYVYIAAEKSGIIKIDISNPTSPKHIHTFDTAGEAVHVLSFGDYIFASDTNSLLLLK